MLPARVGGERGSDTMSECWEISHKGRHPANLVAGMSALSWARIHELSLLRCWRTSMRWGRNCACQNMRQNLAALGQASVLLGMLALIELRLLRCFGTPRISKLETKGKGRQIVQLPCTVDGLRAWQVPKWSRSTLHMLAIQIRSSMDHLGSDPCLSHLSSSVRRMALSAAPVLDARPAVSLVGYSPGE